MAAQREAVLGRARAAGVRGLLLAGVERSSWQIEAALSARHPELLIAYGIHPQIVPELDDAALTAQLEALDAALRGMSALPRPHAIGELGLDARGENRASLPRQEAVFRAQLTLARVHELPIVLHIVRTHGEALRILKADGVPQRGGVVHSYSGSAELVAEYLSLGLYISFSGALTYPQARRLRAAARAVPLHRLLVETDAPDQTPWPRRPAPNEPSFLGDIIDALAHIRNEPRALICQATDENARRLFASAAPS